MGAEMEWMKLIFLSNYYDHLESNNAVDPEVSEIKSMINKRSSKIFDNSLILYNCIAFKSSFIV